MTSLDHLVWAAPDLDRAVDHLEALTGLRAGAGGAHPGNGTRNAILGLTSRSYVEVLAPDPTQTALASPAADLAKLPGPRLHTFAVATDRLDRVAAKLEKAGLPHAGIVPMSRRLPNGRLVRWRLLIPAGHAYGPLVPFFIDWGDSPHPAEGAESPCRLSRLNLVHPEAWSLRPLLERLEVEAQVEAGPVALAAEIQTPKGAVTLSSRDHVPG